MTSRSSRIRAASGALPKFHGPGLDGGTVFLPTLRLKWPSLFDCDGLTQLSCRAAYVHPCGEARIVSVPVRTVEVFKCKPVLSLMQN